MKRLGQKITTAGPVPGDCLRTALAMLLHLDDAAGVPHFVRDDEDRMDHVLARANRWLRPQGMNLLTFPVRDQFGLDWVMQYARIYSGDAPYIVFVHQAEDNLDGMSKDAHAIVVRDGEVWCDPAWPKLRGILPNESYRPDPNGYWWICVLAKR